VVGIFQNFSLGRILFRPVPFLLKFFGELKRVFETVYVTACARITVSVPRAANTASCFIDLNTKAKRTKFIEGIQAREAGSNYYDVKLLVIIH